MSISDYKVTKQDTEGKMISELSDRPSADGLSAEELKQRFDALSNLLVERLNSVIEALQAVTGAAEVGARIDGIEGNTVAQALKNAALLAMAAKEEAEGKQDVLNFDSAPMVNSLNPVTSGGVYQALQDMSISGGVVVDSVIQDSPNPVKNAAIYAALGAKVDKVSGKGLSTNDYTSAEKSKLAGVAEGANKTVVDEALSSISTNPVQNKTVAESLALKQNKVTFSTTDLEDGVSTLATGELYAVYEE